MASSRASNLKLILIMAPVVVLWLALSEWEPLQPIFKPLENLAMDWRFQVRGELEVPEAHIVYANVDEATSAYWGERPFPRSQYAQLARVLIEHGKAKAVGFDFVFSSQAHSSMVSREAIIQNDLVLAELSRLYPQAIFAAFYSGTTLPLTIEDRKKDRSTELVEERLREFPYLRQDPQAGGDTFHIFLSHTWSFGQDQMRIVKQRMLELLPGIRIFLDVDDLAAGKGGVRGRGDGCGGAGSAVAAVAPSWQGAGLPEGELERQAAR